MRKVRLFKFLIIISILFFNYVCEEQKINEEKRIKRIDSTAVKDTLVKHEKVELKIKYYKYPVAGLRTLTDLRKEYGFPKRRIILALNRIDHDNITPHDTLMIPDTVSTDIMIYSPFPKVVSFLDSIPKILLFSYPIESFAAYQNGILARWGPTSLGKRSTPTPEGLFFTNWKSKETRSTDDSTWILPWYFNLDNKRGISLHEFALPGYPASHACARLLEEDAEWIYNWADQWIITKDGEKVIANGTPVIIYGKFNYKSKPLWKYLADDPHAADISEAKIDSLVSPFLNKIKEKKAVRDSVLNARNKIALEK